MRTWCGFRPWAPDGLPIIGAWPGLDGLFVATAHFRSGILLAPITAQLMTQWIVEGRPSLAVAAVAPDRFAENVSAYGIIQGAARSMGKCAD